MDGAAGTFVLIDDHKRFCGAFEAVREGKRGV
jgi:hypothetical protein